MIWARMLETHILNREYRKYRLRTTEINKAEINKAEVNRTEFDKTGDISGKRKSGCICRLSSNR